MSKAHIRFNSDNEDDGDDYELSASDNEYTEEEQQLLKKASRAQEQISDGEEEVYGVGSNSDIESNDSDLAVSDVEQADDDDLPDVRAWGKDKRQFYSTDYVDPDYGGFQGKDATLAELEEEEAKNLQKQLIEELDDNDFNLDIFTKKSDDVKKSTEEIIKTDVSKLSKRQKFEILQKESPEFFGLIEDYKNKMQICKDFLLPIIELGKDGKIPSSNALDFVKLKYQHILNYCTNIYMYLLLKLNKINIKNHPVAKRLYQYRKMLSQFEPIFLKTIKPQIEILLQENVNSENSNETQNTRTLKILKKLTKKAKEEKNENKVSKRNAEEILEVEQPSLKKKKIQVQESSDSEEEEAEVENVEETSENKNGEIEKRAITYQIAKNKGLTPYRKKDQRNPRVKHRNKFRKAKICRKGAVREVRKEVSRYGGEISGIKASVSKSIKLK